ncbi:MAG: NAD-binding protein [Phycisphaerales bacterium]|nr:MAG: NAD-binding protein [Phycisphaerales bacterium]
MIPVSDDSREGVYRDGQVHLDQSTDWPDGTKLRVTPLVPLADEGRLDGHVIIVGFGLAGRCVADLLEQAKIPYTIVERNPVTVATQRALGRQIIFGNAIEAKVLNEAGLSDASILALTIPDEDAVLDATSLARRLKPDIFIVARTNYSSKGMKATQLGADDVIKAEQAVALQFYDKVHQRIHQMTQLSLDET